MDFSQFKEKYQHKEVIEVPHKVNTTPLVSVMVQTYQHANYLKDCLEGILKQKTSFPFEILLGEDDSTDGTRQICLDYAERYPEKIRLFLHHPDNKIQVMGITTGNFNALYNFYSARGKYIAFCEGDDCWTDPFKLQKQVDFLEDNPEFVLSYHRFQELVTDSTKGEAPNLLEQPAKDLEKEELTQLLYHPLLSTICFKNSFNGDLPEEMLQVLNVDSFLISLMGNFGKGKFLEEIRPSIYRRHASGSWTSKNGDLRLLLKLNTLQKLENYYLRIKRPQVASFFHLRVKQYHRSLCRFYFVNGKLKSSIKYLPKAI